MPITHNYLEVADRKPTAAEATKAELIPNLADGTLWSKNGSGTVIQVGGAADGLVTGDIGVTVQGFSTILSATTASFLVADKNKLNHITVTQAVNLDTMESNIATNNAKISNVTTNLGYTASPTNGIVTSSDGNNATLPLATGTNAGLLAPADFTKLGSQSGTNTGDEPTASTTVAGIVELATTTETNAGSLSNRAVTPASLTNVLANVATNNAKVSNVSTNLGYTASPTNGVVTSSDGTNATLPLGTGTNAGLLTPLDFTKIGTIESGAEQNNISDANATALTGGGATTLHKHDISDMDNAGTVVTYDVGTLSGTIPVLDGNNHIPSTMLPPIAITTTYVVANQAAQLALTVQEGDVAVRTDENKSYIALNADNVDMGDWQQLLFPTASGTNLSVGTRTATTLQVVSSSGGDVDIPLATTVAGGNDAGLLSPSEKDAITANSAKVSNVTTNLGWNAGTRQVTSSDGTNATLTHATGSASGLMTSAQFNKLGYITVTQAVDLDTMESNQTGSLLTGEAV